MPEIARPVTIRLASASDAPSLAALLGELGYPSEPERVAARLERLRGPDAPDTFDRVFVAAAADAAAGPTADTGKAGSLLGMLSVHRFSALHADAPVALITALVVVPVARGLGVGRRLVDRAVETGRGWGCERLIVTTHVRRADAHAFYERIGFEMTGRRYARTL